MSKYHHNENYFLIPTIKNCYWAGFIAADGCIQNKCLTIYLSEKDDIILKRFKKDINFTGKINYCQTKDNRYIPAKIYKSSRLIIYNNGKILTDLYKNFNIIPRKSLILEPPNLIDKEQILSYIIGYIDGDGTIYYINNPKQDISLCILGTKEVLTWINNQFNNIGLIYQKTKNKNTYALSFTGQEARNILKKLKKHINKFKIKVLNRKWNKVTKEKLNQKSNPNFKLNRKKCKIITPEIIYNGWINGKTQKELSKIYQCSITTIENRIKKYKEKYLC